MPPKAAKAAAKKRARPCFRPQGETESDAALKARRAAFFFDHDPTLLSRKEAAEFACMLRSMDPEQRMVPQCQYEPDEAYEVRRGWFLRRAEEYTPMLTQAELAAMNLEEYYAVHPDEAPK